VGGGPGNCSSRGNGIDVQRLFSSFADGPLGAGPLIQRLLVGAALLYCGAVAPSGTIAAPQVIGAVAGLLLIAGLWTPVAGVAVACAEAWVAFSSPARAGIPAALAGAGRDVGADRARRVVRRCTPLRQEALRPSRAAAPLGCPPVPAMTLFPTRSCDACAGRVQAGARMSGARPLRGGPLSPESGSAVLNHPTTSTRD